MAKILAFSGSARHESYNQKLVRIAATGAEGAGAQITVINLGDYPLPIYNQDLEAAEGLPANAKALKSLFREHDGLLIASPEYNGAFSPLLKNALDWVSRKEAGETYQVAFKNKVAAIMSTSLGALGGMRGLVFLRMLLGNVGILVLPEQKAIPNAAAAFDENGNLHNQADQDAILQLGGELAATITKLQR